MKMWYSRLSPTHIVRIVRIRIFLIFSEIRYTRTSFASIGHISTHNLIKNGDFTDGKLLQKPVKDANKDIRVELTESLSFLPVWLHSECSFPLSSHASRFLFEIFIQTFNYRSFPYKNTFLMKAANLSTFSCFPGYFSYTVHPGFYDS